MLSIIVYSIITEIAEWHLMLIRKKKKASINCINNRLHCNLVTFVIIIYISFSLKQNFQKDFMKKYCTKTEFIIVTKLA